MPWTPRRFGLYRLPVLPTTSPRLPSLTEQDLAKHFNGAPQNIGLLLGDKYGTTDIDLDCMEAVRAARFFLPETRMVFGRASKPASHHFYRADPPIPSRKFIDTDKSTICEFRRQKLDGTMGFQTVVPPSAHEATGEEIRFEPGCGPQPANIDADVLVLAVARTAAAALLARHWPERGQGRHDTMLALAGGLARAGWNEPDAKVFCHAVYQSLADPDPSAQTGATRKLSPLSGEEPRTRSVQAGPM